MARERWGAATNDGAGRRQGPPSCAGGRERAARGAAAPAARPEAAGPRLGPHRHRAPLRTATPHRGPAPAQRSAPGHGSGTPLRTGPRLRQRCPPAGGVPAVLGAVAGRCRREEKRPRVPTDLPEERRLRKISVQPFPAVQQSQDSCEWPNG
ncbi:adropin isoform X2 [Patagioenas fasciata]|uniref:adropin isoform X2 n=1 Tax=Patagioenas fasciata TaxID=372321 RepID=UPI003A98DF41